MRNRAGGVTLWIVNFYLDAAAIGIGLSAAWIAWLYTARAALRRFRLRPGYLMTFLQIGVVLILIAAAYSVSDFCLYRLGMHTPENVVFFRRIWIAIWALGMLASIRIFIDIRRMAESEVQPRATTNRPPSRSARRRQSRR